MVGVRAVFDAKKNDRRYQAYCQDAQDKSGALFVRKSCSWTSRLHDPRKTLDLAKNPCDENEFIGGFQVSYDASSKDRIWQVACCTYEASTPLQWASPESCIPSLPYSPYTQGFNNRQVNILYGLLDFQCIQGYVLKRIGSNYDPGDPSLHNADRRFSFDCCKIATSASDSVSTSINTTP
jgi:hypothetical protein